MQCVWMYMQLNVCTVCAGNNTEDEGERAPHYTEIQERRSNSVSGTLGTVRAYLYLYVSLYVFMYVYAVHVCVSKCKCYM